MLLSFSVLGQILAIASRNSELRRHFSVLMGNSGFWNHSVSPKQLAFLQWKLASALLLLFVLRQILAMASRNSELRKHLSALMGNFGFWNDAVPPIKAAGLSLVDGSLQARCCHSLSLAIADTVP